MAAGDKKPKSPALGKPKPTHLQRSQQTERETAERLGGRVVSGNSGAGLVNKGDVLLRDFLLDEKRTGGSALNVMRRDLVKITRLADERGKLPGIAMRFDGTADVADDLWVAIPADVFKRLLNLEE